MTNYTTDLYELKRENIKFSTKVTKDSNQVETKFIKQMIYGITKSRSVILSNISDALDEENKKINTVERLSRNLDKTLNLDSTYENYMSQINEVLDDEPIILVDDSDIIKPHGKKFEFLGRVRDGSSKSNKIEKGYHVTEMVALSKKQKQPISVYSHIHSSYQKNYKSTNDETFKGIDQVIEKLDRKCTFIFDRGYDGNNLIKKVIKEDQNFILRITERRNLLHKGKKYKATTLRDARKGKIKMNIMFQDESKDCYISHLNVKISASKKEMRLVLVYGLGEKAMMILTNKKILSKQDAINIVRQYMSRWRIEEYFRFKKQDFGFEDFRVRSLESINNLNQILTYAIGFIGLLVEQMDEKLLVIKIIERAKAIKSKILFHYYQVAKGMFNILAHAKKGIGSFLNIRKKHPFKQLEMKLNC